jgi:hypothetical protein
MDQLVQLIGAFPAPSPEKNLKKRDAELRQYTASFAHLHINTKQAIIAHPIAALEVSHTSGRAATSLKSWG